MAMLTAVPEPMRVCPQWLLWKPVWLPDRNKWTKVPVSARTGYNASVRKQSDWSSFETSCAIYTQHAQVAKLGGLGFVFGYASGIGGLDCDNVLDPVGNVVNYEAVEIVRRFETYTEVSPSGTGLHALFFANVPDGRRTKSYELYGEGRFFSVTGNAYFNQPLANRQTTVDAFLAYIDADRARAIDVKVDWSVQPTRGHEDIWQMCISAANGTKFFELFNGQYQSYYGSQSEADFALIDIIAFYSDSPSQVYTMFMSSKLAERDKARERPKYVQAMVSRSFDRKVPLIAIPALPVRQHIETLARHEYLSDEDAEEASQRVNDPFVMPPGNGLIGRIAEYIYQQAPYPMREAALMAALALMAGICGRQYQFKRKGLNLYLMLLANTGSGKEAMSTGIGSIMEAVCNPTRDVNAPITTNLETIGYPSARAFRGPAKLTGKGLLTTLAKCDPLSCFSILNEFADTMRQMADPRGGNQGIADLKTALLDLYMKSTAGNFYAGHVTADKETTVKAINSPAFTFLSECPPNKLYTYLNEDLITDGMLPRLIIFESHGYGDYNPNYGNVSVPADVARDVTTLCKLVMQMKMQDDRRVEIATDETGAARSEEFRVYARTRITATGSNDATRELWNRAHLNVERIAGLVAVGVNPYQPVVTADMIDWAARIITRQIVLLAAKFRRGETGDVVIDDDKQVKDLQSVIRRWSEYDPNDMPKSYRDQASIDARMVGAVTYRYMQQSVAQRGSFRQDKRGATAALRIALDTMVKTGELEPVRIDRHSATFYKFHLLD